jgi:hypothetical protein
VSVYTICIEQILNEEDAIVEKTSRAQEKVVVSCEHKIKFSVPYKEGKSSG